MNQQAHEILFPKTLTNLNLAYLPYNLALNNISIVPNNLDISIINIEEVLFIDT